MNKKMLSYDLGDRLVLTQDGNRRTEGKWLFRVEDTLTPESRCGYEIIGEINGYGARYAPSAQGLLTGSLRGILGNAGINEYLWSSRYYDAKGRLVQEHAAQAPMNKWSRTYYAYDYTGNLIKRGTEHNSFSSTVAKETYTYNYDGWGRPTVTTHKLGTGSAVTLFSRTYDRAGRLVTEARNGGTTGLQTEYSYNVRSWLTDLSVGSAGSTFKQKLYYNEARDNATATAYQWGGNIARMDWKAGGEERTYQFGYDLLSRLTGATYSGPDTYQDNFTRTYGYDVNGNVTSRGVTSYTYGGNHLSTGTYDANGNLTAGMGYTTSYNLLNLPSSAVNADQTTYYFYSSDGVKVEKDVIENNMFTPSFYAGNLLYDDISPKMLLIEGGYIDLSGDTPAYRFYVTDHQGNIRAVTDGTGTVLRTNHYDPYGEEVLPVLAPSGTLPTSTAGTDAASRYMYGAKEWDANLSLYDFSARYYTPSGAASFTTMDPLCEKYYSISPYAYCINNPERFVDPIGLTVYVIDGEKRIIDDGKSETVALNESCFALLYYLFTNDRKQYNRQRGEYMDQFGYIDSNNNYVLSASFVASNRHQEQSTVSQAWGMGSSASSLALNATAETRYSSFIGGWTDSSGQFYYKNVEGKGKHFLHGNRAEALRISKWFKRGGRVLGYASIAFDFNDIASAYHRGDNPGLALEIIDLAVDGVGFIPYCSLVPLLWNFGVRSYVESSFFKPADSINAQQSNLSSQ